MHRLAVAPALAAKRAARLSSLGLQAQQLAAGERAIRSSRHQRGDGGMYRLMNTLRQARLLYAATKRRLAEHPSALVTINRPIARRRVTKRPEIVT